MLCRLNIRIDEKNRRIVSQSACSGYRQSSGFPPRKAPSGKCFSEKNSGMSEREARVPEFLKNTLAARTGLFAGRVSLLLSSRGQRK
jgi:hypothetical protein